MICQKGIEHDAVVGVVAKGLPGLRIVTTNIPAGTGQEREIILSGLTKEVVDNIITALTKPLTQEEKSPTIKKTESPARIIFKGSLEEINQFFYTRGWSGGLPVIPPTEEAVKEMLQGTDLPANHVVAKLPVRFGNATVEKIAVNAVMAGALPTFMPVLIAGVKALADHIETEHVMGTLVSPAPCWIINGQVRKDINVNSSYSLFSSEKMANAVIARAMRLIIRNIGGLRPGLESMSWYGHEGSFSLAFGENEEDSPWEPLHVELGLNKADSAVSLYFVSGSTELLIKNNVYTDDKHCLRVLADHVAGNMSGAKGIGGANSLFILSPGTAKLLANQGWTKKKIVSHILEQTRNIPKCEMVERFQAAWGYPEEGLKIIVAGGGLTDNAAFQFNGGYCGFITRRVELPANWDELVKKYTLSLAYDQ